MREIRKLELSELKEIYKKYMKIDFPLMELRPWFSIDRAWDRDGYTAYGYYEGEQLIAYASFYACTESSCVLMDYYAVIPELRGKGIGSSFLRELMQVVASASGIYGEVESVSSAKDEKERNLRKRRLDFYNKNGAVMTGVNCHLFGVDYNILCFSETEKKITRDEYYDAVCSMYMELYRPVYGRICRPYLEGRV